MIPLNTSLLIVQDQIIVQNGLINEKLDREIKSVDVRVIIVSSLKEDISESLKILKEAYPDRIVAALSSKKELKRLCQLPFSFVIAKSDKLLPQNCPESFKVGGLS